MILIRKGSPPPELTAKLAANPQLTYGYLGDTTDIIKASLLAEQGYLCAYCMKRIDKAATIEHYKSQKEYQELSAEYTNMLGVCLGNRGKLLQHQTCDARRESTSLTVNPLCEDSVSQIKYRHDGTIYSDDTAIENDLNYTLNLNCHAVSLPDKRRAVLNSLQRKIKQQTLSGKKLHTAYWQNLLAWAENPHKGQKNEYAGILIWYIRDKMQCALTHSEPIQP